MGSLALAQREAVVTIQIIDIAREFSQFPGGRYRDKGKFSGEEFREEVLWPALQNGGKVVIVLDGTAGYSASFLEEAFGGLVRQHPEVIATLSDRLEVRASDPHYDTYRTLIGRYIDDAKSRLKPALN